MWMILLEKVRENWKGKIVIETLKKYIRIGINFVLFKQILLKVIIEVEIKCQ